MANPTMPVQFYKGTPPIREKRSALDGQTWKVGHPLRLTDSGLVKVKSAGTSIYGYAADDQLTSTSSSTVPVDRIADANAEYVVVARVTAAGNDTKAPITNVGKLRVISVSDCIAAVSLTDDTSTGVYQVVDQLARVEAFRNDTSDVPGYYTVRHTAASLTAQGDM